MPEKHYPKSDKVTGWFIIGAALAGMALLFFVKVLPMLTTTPHVEVTVYFDDIGTLDLGDTVCMQGAPIGYVKDKALEAQTVRVVLAIKPHVVIREGTKFSIQDKTILGGRQVVLMPGSGPPARHDEFVGEKLVDLTRALSKILMPVLAEDGNTGFIRNFSDLTKQRYAGVLPDLFNEKSQLAIQLASIKKALSGEEDSLLALLSKGGEFWQAVAVIKKSAGNLSDPAYAAGQLKPLLLPDAEAGDGTGADASADRVKATPVARIKRNVAELSKAIKASQGSLPLFDGDSPAWQRWQALKASLTGLQDSQDSLLTFFTSGQAGAVFDDIRLTFHSLMTKMGSGHEGQNAASATALDPQNLPGFLTQFMRYLMGHNENLQEDSPFIRFVSLSKLLGFWE